MIDAHTQAVVVATLARMGTASVASLAHDAGLDEGTVRRALRALERAGITSRPRSHGPWSLVAAIATATASGPITAGDMVCQRADGSVAAATRPESNDREPDPPRVATGDDRAPTGKKPLPWWHGNPSTRSWWERKRLKNKELHKK